jgi:lipopolysaccharide/colanic/teichoic acid biosynthesis glycosyltransferase
MRGKLRLPGSLLAMTILSTNAHADLTASSWSTESQVGPFVFKRMLDVVLGSLAAIICAPVLGLCVLLIKLSDPGPAIYAQWRVGRHGRLFRIYKLRTMRYRAEHGTGAVCAQLDDQRVMAVCRWMRQSHVDELPQLWNIISGEMSLVGPRPERPEIHERICEMLPEFRQRLAVKPGLTGLAQLRNGYTNDLGGNKRKLEYDLVYIGRMNWWTELKLLVLTVPKFWDRKAH